MFGKSACEGAVIFVEVDADDVESARKLVRAAFGGYVATPVYNRFFDWVGYGDVAKGVQAASAAKDRAGSALAMTVDFVDAVTILGSASECRDKLAAFAEKILGPGRSLVKIREDMPLDRASLIGCGITTGLGAALNTVNIPAGASVVIIGCGGVGLSALQGARIRGASKIIAVDAQSWKFDLARKLGATDCIDATDGDAVAAVQGLTGGGADFVFECIGLVPTVQQAVAMTGRGGTAVLVGVVPMQLLVPLSAADITLQEKNVTGSYMGSNRFRFDMPKYIGFYLDGRLHLDDMISSRIKLDDINDGFDRMKKGEVARQVIVFD